MRGLTRLGLALVIVFLASLLALAAELVYLLWYRRRSSRRVSSDQEVAAAAMAGGDSLGGSPTSKELLLYVLCWKNQSRIEPTTAPVPKLSPPPPQPAEDDAVDDELEKWRGMYASRVLFTISEGEKEGVDSDGGSGRVAPPPPPVGLTPFSTPCGSPPFFTPPPSPPRSSRNLLAGDKDEEDNHCGPRAATAVAAAAAAGGGELELELEQELR